MKKIKMFALHVVKALVRGWIGENKTELIINTIGIVVCLGMLVGGIILSSVYTQMIFSAITGMYALFLVYVLLEVAYEYWNAVK